MPFDRIVTKEDRRMRLPWWGVLCVGLGAFLLFFLFDHFGKFAFARPTLYAVSVIVITIAMRWKLKEQAWFWITMASLSALHILLILLVPWTSKWIPALVVIPIGIADSYAMLWVILFVGKLVGQPNDSHKISTFRR